MYASSTKYNPYKETFKKRHKTTRTQVGINKASKIIVLRSLKPEWPLGHLICLCPAKNILAGI